VSSPGANDHGKDDHGSIRTRFAGNRSITISHNTAVSAPVAQMREPNAGGVGTAPPPPTRRRSSDYARPQRGSRSDSQIRARSTSTEAATDRGQSVLDAPSTPSHQSATVPDPTEAHGKAAARPEDLDTRAQLSRGGASPALVGQPAQSSSEQSCCAAATTATPLSPGETMPANGSSNGTVSARPSAQRGSACERLRGRQRRLTRKSPTPAPRVRSPARSPEMLV